MVYNKLVKYNTSKGFLTQGGNMDWLDEVNARYKKRNQIFFAKDSAYLQDLIVLFQNQSHKVMILWAFDFAAESIAQLKVKYPDDNRPQEALKAAQSWAAGKIKMRLAQRKILDCHAFAKELECKEDIAVCHAAGQACSVVHTAGHAIGYPIYDLTSIVYRLGVENCSEQIECRKQSYIDRLLFWQRHIGDYQGTWADFI